MPVFATAEPISVTLALTVADVRIVAGDRADTVVEIGPSDPAGEADIGAAARTRVEFDDGHLLVRTPRSWRDYTPRGGGESVDVTIELPAGSSVEVTLVVGDVRTEGRLGTCRMTTSAGNLRLAHAGAVRLTTTAGSIGVERADGALEVDGSGEVRIGAVAGPATVKNRNGHTWIGEAGGDLRCNAANGDIVVDRSSAVADLRTANGAIRVGEVAGGSVALSAGMGELEVGVPTGTAALLDLRSRFGKVRSALDGVAGPQPGDTTVEVHARTSYGDIVVRRP